MHSATPHIAYRLLRAQGTHGFARNSRQALDLCLDEDDALRIKELLLAEATEEREGEEGKADSEDGEQANKDTA
jgi:hypothetical protein